MKQRLTIAQRSDAKTAISLVMNAVEACETGDEALELALNLLHGAAAALVGVTSHDYAVEYLRTLTGVIEREACDEKLSRGN